VSKKATVQFCLTVSKQPHNDLQSDDHWNFIRWQQKQRAKSIQKFDVFKSFKMHKINT